MTDAQVAAQVWVASVVPRTPSAAICSGLPVPSGPAILSRMGTKSRETIYGGSVRAAAERAATEDNAYPRAGAVHALQALLTATGATVQAQPSGRAATEQDHGERSAL